jgi:hypothetical protein
MDEKEVSNDGRNDSLRRRAPQTLQDSDDQGRVEPGEEHAACRSDRQHKARDDQDETAAKDVGERDPEDVSEPEDEDVELRLG